MRRLWLFWLPLLFLPNLGYEQATPFGTLTLADFLIGPYLILVYFGSQHSRAPGKLRIDAIVPLLVAFLWWASISTLLLPLRYDYPDYHPLWFGLLKLGKLSLYGLAGVLTTKALADDEKRTGFYWSFLAAGVIVGVTLFLTGNAYENTRLTASGSGAQVYLDNPVSAMMSILITFFAGSLLAGNGTPRWRRYASIGLIIMFLGFIMAEGRGGWLAALVGVLYLLSHVHLRRTLVASAVGLALVFYAYNQFPSFKEQVDRTLQPDMAYLERYQAGVFGIDDGARLITLKNEAPKLLDSPLLGRGFFHRGGLSGLFSTGSHNFFLQMFLETGVPGGLLVLAIFWRMWRHAAQPIPGSENLKLPVRAALIAAFVVGLSGEYFYGGMTLFTLLLAYAPVGSSVNPAPVAGRLSLLALRYDSRHYELGALPDRLGYPVKKGP